MYDYGARGYMPDLGRWGGVDALAESYYPFSAYSYALNNPFTYMDVDGKRLIVTFRGEGSPADEFKKILNHMFQGQFIATFKAVKNEKGGNISGKYEIGIKATKNGGDIDKLSEGGKSFYKMAKEIIDNKTIVDINIESNSEYEVADYDNNRIDIFDISAFPAFDHKKKYQDGPTDAGKLGHELWEQFGKALDGYKRGQGKGYELNHENAIYQENNINRNKRLGTRMTRNGVIQTYKTPDGKVSEWVTQVQNGRFIVKRVK